MSTTKIAYLTGDTYMVRTRLHDAGWRWDDERGAYKKAGEWDSEEHVIRSVRRLPGIRNRGNFSVVLEVAS